MMGSCCELIKQAADSAPFLCPPFPLLSRHRPARLASLIRAKLEGDRLLWLAHNCLAVLRNSNSRLHCGHRICWSDWLMTPHVSRRLYNSILGASAPSAGSNRPNRLTSRNRAHPLPQTTPREHYKVAGSPQIQVDALIGKQLIAVTIRPNNKIISRGVPMQKLQICS